jgi:hypothetical protein
MFESVFPEPDENEELRRKVADLEFQMSILNERNIASIIRGELKTVTKKTYVGDGSDGNANFDGSNAVTGASRSGTTYTLNQDVNYNNVIVANNVVVLGRQYYLQIKGTLTNRGTIYANGGWW